MQGQHLRFGEALSCKFGLSTVQAAFTANTGRVECRAPPNNASGTGEGPGEVDFSVMLNGFDVAQRTPMSLVYTYVAVRPALPNSHICTNVG